MLGRNRLVWSVDPFNQHEAKDGPYTFAAWANNKGGELRIVRRDNVGGIIVPMQDFSIYTRDLKAAKALAEKLNRLLRKSRRYNGLITL